MANPSLPPQPPALLPMCGPFQVVRFDSLPSTSSHARRLSEEDRLRPPCVIVADRQTAGRGRHGRTWQSDAGSLTATFCLTVPRSSPAGSTLGPRAAIAACAALGRFVPRCRIKWPNDVLIDDRKVAGLLVERLGGVVLIGVGVNVVSAPPVDVEGALPPTAIADHVPGPAPAADRVLEALCSELHSWLTGDADLGDAWTALDALAGRSVELAGHPQGPLSGVAEGIDSAGRLLIRTDGSVVTVESGTVRLRSNR